MLSISKESHSKIEVMNEVDSEGQISIVVDIYPKDYVSGSLRKKVESGSYLTSRWVSRLESIESEIMDILDKCPIEPDDVNGRGESDGYSQQFVEAFWFINIPKDIKGRLIGEIFTLLEYLEDSFGCEIFIG